MVCSDQQGLKGQSRYSILVCGPVRPTSWSAVALLGIAFLSWYATDSLSFGLSVGLVVFYFIASLFLAYRASTGIFPSMRLLLLAGPGVVACIIYWLTDETMFVIYYAGEWLNTAFVREFAMASVIAGIASIVGHTAGARSMPEAFRAPLYKADRSEIKTVVWVGLAVSALTLGIMAFTAGNPIYETGSYIQTIGTKKDIPFRLGVYNSVGVYFLLVSFMGLHYRNGRMRRLRILWAVLALVILINAMMRGLRQDSFPVLGIMIFFYWLLSRRRPPARPILYTILIVCVGYFLAVFTGHLRTTFSWETIQRMVETPEEMFFFDNYVGAKSFSLETASSTTGTFLAVFLKTAGGTKDLLLGSSYLDFIPRTPPEILYPGRPQDLAWQMQYNGYWLAAGGILEISEAYWNFSRLGVLIVPLVISYVVTRVSLKLCDCLNPMFVAFPLAIMATMPRWILYQTFALYKGSVAIVIASLMVWIITKVLVGGARPGPFSNAKALQGL